jgi:hypothetical protein
MWKVLIIGAIMALLTAYLKYKSAGRSRRGEGSWVDRHVATPPGVIACACVVLLVIAAALWWTEFGSRAQQRQRLAEELAWRRLLAAQLGAELVRQLPAELTAGGTPKALVIDQRLLGSSSDPCHDAMVAGLTEGFGGKITIGASEWLGLPTGSDASEEALTKANQLTNQQLDGLVEKNADCQVIVSLIGLPAGYGRSVTMSRARAGKLTVGAYTPSVYMLGGAIQHKGVTACVVPKGSFLEEGKLPDLTQAEAAFGQRYLLLTAANVLEVQKTEKRLFRMR